MSKPKKPEHLPPRDWTFHLFGNHSDKGDLRDPSGNIVSAWIEKQDALAILSRVNAGPAADALADAVERYLAGKDGKAMLSLFLKDYRAKAQEKP